MNKIGISTLNSYRGAQIFEGLGLSQNFIDQFLLILLQELKELACIKIEKDITKRHSKAYFPMSLIWDYH
ncbi:MAG: hypothetical protein CM15mP40_09180 [Alphaproteobacteria bacterium]|nr:MAG: hypothetical protein CM15mP40_09180 [Alphaproteobacteria bacterium]